MHVKICKQVLLHSYIKTVIKIYYFIKWGFHLKYLSAFLVLSLVLLTGCTQESKGDAVVKHVELTKFEEGLVNLTSERSFIFDMEINNDEVTEFIGTVDYYENGKLVRQVCKLGSAIEQESIDDTVRVTFIQQPVNENEEKWLISTMTDDGQISGSFKNDIAGKERMTFGSTSEGVNEGPLIVGENKVIGAISYFVNGSSTYSIKTKEDMQRATDYEQAYLISVELR